MKPTIYDIFIYRIVCFFWFHHRHAPLRPGQYILSEELLLYSSYVFFFFSCTMIVACFALLYLYSIPSSSYCLPVVYPVHIMTTRG